MGRWDNSNRSSRLPSNWQSIRLAVLRRDRYTCQNCGAEGNEVDHIEAGDDHSMANLQTLCRSCHATKTHAEGTAARRRRMHELRRMTRRQPEPSPGAIPPHKAKPSGRKGW